MSYSATRSRCQCGHKIVLVDGHWQHENPHPEHACTCKEPAPSENIGMARTCREPVVKAGICGGLLMAHYGRDDLI